MNKAKIKLFLQNAFFFFLGMLLYNLIFHREEGVAEILLRCAVVSLLASAIGVLWGLRTKQS